VTSTVTSTVTSVVTSVVGCFAIAIESCEVEGS
jgi:hypothetical protein